jgi:hypothetical protein
MAAARGRRAVLDKQRTIGNAVDGCFDPTRKVMNGTPGVIPKSGHRFSDKITPIARVIPKSGHRFSDKITPIARVIPKSGHRFSDKVTPIARVPEKWAPVFGRDHAL